MTGTPVAKGLAGGHAHRTLFESLDLTVAPGDVIGAVGASGAGKTTLLNLLAGRAPLVNRPAGWAGPVGRARRDHGLDGALRYRD